MNGATDACRARVADVRGRIDAAAARVGRDAGTVRLVAVGKQVDVDAIRRVLAAGVSDLGENRAQDLTRKAAALEDAGDGAVWHFVGRLQRNKIAALARRVTWWHSVDRPELAEPLSRHAPAGRFLVQVNVGREPQKGGCPPEETGALVGVLRDRGLDVAGLMAVPPADADPRPHFAALRSLAEDLGLRELSMGMTADFETAVEEGATMVRVGTALFGPRPGTTGLRR